MSGLHLLRPFSNDNTPMSGRQADEWAKQATTAELEKRLRPLTDLDWADAVRGDFETDGSAA